jgi:hypothetical protein
MTRKELSFFGSDFASTVCSLSWALSRPSWISARSMAENVRVKMIRWFIISFVGFFVFSGGMVLFIVTLKDAG